MKAGRLRGIDRKSTRLNSSHSSISYAVFCLKKNNALSVQTEPSRASILLHGQPYPSCSSILLDGKPPQVPPNTFTHVPFGLFFYSAALHRYEPLSQARRLPG